MMSDKKPSIANRPFHRSARERPETASIGGLAVHDGDERCVREQLHCAHEEHQSTGGGIKQLLQHGQSCRLLRDESPHQAQHGEAAVDGLRGSPIESEDAQERLLACLGSPLDLLARSESHRSVETCGGLGSEVGALLGLVGFLLLQNFVRSDLFLCFLIDGLPQPLPRFTTNPACAGPIGQCVANTGTADRQSPRSEGRKTPQHSCRAGGHLRHGCGLGTQQTEYFGVTELA